MASDPWRLASAIAHVVMLGAILMLRRLRRRYSKNVGMLSKAAKLDWNENRRLHPEMDDDDRALLAHHPSGRTTLHHEGKSKQALRGAIVAARTFLVRKVELPKRVVMLVRRSLNRCCGSVVYALFSCGPPVQVVGDEAGGVADVRGLAAAASAGHVEAARGIFGYDLDTFVELFMLLLVTTRGVAALIMYLIAIDCDILTATGDVGGRTAAAALDGVAHLCENLIIVAIAVYIKDTTQQLRAAKDATVFEFGEAGAGGETLFGDESGLGGGGGEVDGDGSSGGGDGGGGGTDGRGAGEAKEADGPITAAADGGDASTSASKYGESTVHVTDASASLVNCVQGEFRLFLFTVTLHVVRTLLTTLFTCPRCKNAQMQKCKNAKMLKHAQRARPPQRGELDRARWRLWNCHPSPRVYIVVRVSFVLFASSAFLFLFSSALHSVSSCFSADARSRALGLSRSRCGETRDAHTGVPSPRRTGHRQIVAPTPSF